MKNKVLKNAGWIIGCQIVKAILGLLISMMTARYLGPKDYGIINYAASIVAFVIPIMKLGITSVLVQEFVNKPDKEGEILGTALVMNIISAILCIIGIISFTSIVNRGEKETIIVCGLYSLNLLFQAIEITQYWLQAKYLSRYRAIVSVYAYLFVSIYKIYLLISKKNIYWFAVSQAIDYMIIAIILLIIYKRVGHSKLKFSYSLGKKMLANSKYYIISDLMVKIFANTDSIMLKLISGAEEVGYYNAALTCACMTGFVFSAIIDSARPLIYESKIKNEGKYEKNMIRLYSVIIHFSLLQCIIITIFAELIVNILYGTSYNQAINPLRIVVWYTTFSYLGSVRNIWIISENKQRYLWIINLLGAIANVILNAFLIPRLGGVGAAWASLITQFFTNVFVGFIIKPIRKNNILMIKGMNCKNLIDMLKLVR